MPEKSQNPLEGNSQPIIIKKKKGEHGGHHGGAWKVAYADFVTAMMALFIVLWILGQSEDVKKAVSSYFKDPVGYSQNRGKNVIDLGGAGRNNAQKNSQMTKAVLDSIEKKKIEIEAKIAEKKKLTEAGKNILKEIKTNPDFSAIESKVKISLVDEGLKIEMLESDDFFFEVGTAKLKKNAESLLEKIGIELSNLSEKIVIEGHTDARPYSNSGAGYSNFELSTDRANAARKSLISGGFPMNQIDEVRGFADTRLKDPENPFGAINRRIGIIVKYLK